MITILLKVTRIAIKIATAGKELIFCWIPLEGL